MTLTPAKILRSDALDGAEAASVAQPHARREPYVAPARVAEAAERAEAIVRHAQARARVIVRQAEQAAADRLLAAEAAARADALADVAAWFTRLARRQAEVDAQSFDHLVGLARLLAERLLGRELALDETAIVSLAREALNEATGARQIRLVAHPVDAAYLAPHLAGLSSSAALRLDEDERLERGDLRLETDLGTLDARIGDELDRLASRLRDRISLSMSLDE